MAESIVAVTIDGTRFTCRARPGRSVTLGHDDGADLHLPPALAVPPTTVRLDAEGLHLTVGEQSTRGAPADGPVRLDVHGMRVEAVAGPRGEPVVYDLRGRAELVVGPWPRASLRLADGATFSGRRGQDGRWVVSLPEDGLFFVNNVRRPAGRYVLDDGDRLGFGATDLVLFGDELHIDHAVVLGADLPRLPRSARTLPAGYPAHRRSPRIVHRPPEEKISLSKPPGEQKDEKRAGQLVKLIVPPLAMVGVTGAMAIMRGSIVMVLASAVTTLVTLTFSLTGYVRDRRAQAEQRAAAERAYREHLVAVAIEVHQANARQRRGALYHYPDFRGLVELGTSISPRIFEKTPLHADFLSYRLGLGTVASSSQISAPERDRSGRETELDALARQVCEDGARLERMPITADLMHGPVGYIGPRRLVVEQLQLLVDQIALFHSYHDVQLVMVFGEDELDDWAWMRWFRHSSLQPMNVRAFVHDQRSRDQVLSSLNQILRARRSARDDVRAGQRTRFSPHYVVVILDDHLVLDHVVMELLREDPTDLGCSVVVVQETMSGLSDSITTVIDIRDRQTGVLVLEQSELRDVPFTLDHIPEGVDTEHLPRAVGALEHLQNLTSSIPDAVTFLEMYGVERFDQLDVQSRWARNSPHRTLGVPLGLRGPGDLVTLDLHEKAHGPHGLVAGTTGSGKSEIIQSYILSLAVSFHPHDVAFLLIDYKGGGMANLFADLPHLLGTITNLDGAQSMRALVSINAELKRRQRVFAASGVNHINQYQKLHKNGDVTEPMPHLFLISDEFAELKSEQPEFMDELVSTARIGRSLGIHLILATQKPSGVVNDQIWSNSKFKLALKVADRSDSMEIIKTPDAAEITLPGRAYLQVGNNEIYELFQSAWSGADYAPDKAENHQDDRTIYAITDLGQYRAANEDLSGLDRADTVTSVPTELEAVVRGVREVAQRAEIRPLPRPWLPPLPERIVVTDLHAPALEETWTGAKQPLRPTVGRVDIPGMQTQETLRLDLSGDGHLAVFGSPGYGKSTFLQTLVLDLARTHSPEHLHVYLLDLGTNGLLPLRRLPQVADTVTAEDTDKSAKLVTRLTGELGRRKRLLSEHAVSNLEMYERASGQVMPAVLVVLDSFEGLKGAPAEDAISGLLHSIAREGAGLGLHLVLSGGRPSALRSALSGNIKRQLALRLNDDAEARTIVGRTAVPLEDLPGRGLVRLDQAQVFQTALPAAGEDMFAVLDAIRAECADMDARWQGARPEPIPVVPDRISLSELLRRPEIPRLRAAGIVPVGLDLESVMAVGVDLTRLRQHLVTCVDGGSVAAVLRSLWWAADEADRTRAFLLDDSVGALADLAEESRPGCDRHAVLDAALAELSLRQETRAPAGSPRGPAAVVIADASTISTEIGREHLDDLVRLLTEGPACGMPVLLGAPLSAVGKGVDAVAKVVKRCTSGIVLGAMADQSVLKARNLAFKEPPLAEHEAFLVTDGRAVRVRLPAP